MCAHAPEAIHSTMQTAHMRMLAFLAATVPSHMQVPLTHLPSSRLTPPHALVTFTLAPVTFTLAHVADVVRPRCGALQAPRRRWPRAQHTSLRSNMPFGWEGLGDPLLYARAEAAPSGELASLRSARALAVRLM